MRIPATLKIGGHEVKVIIKKSIEQDKYLGLAELCKKRIILATHNEGSPLPESQRAETLLHEIVHYSVNMVGAPLKERDVKGISEMLFSIIRDNGLDFRKGAK